MSNSIKPVLASSVAGTAGALVTGGGGVGLAVGGGALAVPGAIAVAAVGALGWVAGEVWHLFSRLRRRKPAQRVINVTPVSVSIERETITEDPHYQALCSIFDDQIGLMKQGIF